MATKKKPKAMSALEWDIREAPKKLKKLGVARREGKTSYWLVKLANGHCAVLWKVKGKWRLVEGSKEDALASVPDAHLKDAVNALAAIF